MASYKVDISWQESHSGTIYIEADSIEEANKKMDDSLIDRIQDLKSTVSNTYDELIDNEQEYTIEEEEDTLW